MKWTKTGTSYTTEAEGYRYDVYRKDSSTWRLIMRSTASERILHETLHSSLSAAKDHAHRGMKL